MTSKNLEELTLRYEKHFKAFNSTNMHTTLSTDSIFSDLRYTAITIASVTSIIRHSSSTLKKLDLSYTCVAKVVQTRILHCIQSLQYLDTSALQYKQGLHGRFFESNMYLHITTMPLFPLVCKSQVYCRAGLISHGGPNKVMLTKQVYFIVGS